MVQARTGPLPTAGEPGPSPTARPRAAPSPIDHSPTDLVRPAPPRTAPPQPGRARADPRQPAQRQAVLLRAPPRQKAPARPGRTRLRVDRSARPTTQPASSRRTLPLSTAATRSSATAVALADQVTPGSPAGTVEPTPPITTSPAWSNPAPASPPATIRIPATRPAPTSPARIAPAHPRNQPQPRPRAAPAAGMVRAMPATRAVPPQPPPRHQRIRPVPQRRPARSDHAGTGSTTCGR
jgi:hypothetical protein